MFIIADPPLLCRIYFCSPKRLVPRGTSLSCSIWNCRHRAWQKEDPRGCCVSCSSAFCQALVGRTVSAAGQTCLPCLTMTYRFSGAPQGHLQNSPRASTPFSKRTTTCSKRGILVRHNKEAQDQGWLLQLPGPSSPNFLPSHIHSSDRDLVEEETAKLFNQVDQAIGKFRDGKKTCVSYPRLGVTELDPPTHSQRGTLAMA